MYLRSRVNWKSGEKGTPVGTDRKQQKIDQTYFLVRYIKFVTKKWGSTRNSYCTFIIFEDYFFFQKTPKYLTNLYFNSKNENQREKVTYQSKYEKVDTLKYTDKTEKSKALIKKKVRMNIS